MVVSKLLVLVTARSADGLTGVIVVEVLLLKSGSGVNEATVATLMIAPVASRSTVPSIKTVTESPTASVPKLTLPVHGWKVAPPSVENCGFKIVSGISSFNTTFSALDGPKLRTSI